MCESSGPQKRFLYESFQNHEIALAMWVGR